MQRILVIETDNDIRTLLLITLQLQGYIVCGAPNGVRGAQLIREFRPDLVVVELELPLLSGWDLIRRIKYTYGQRSVPTIALTSYNHISYRLRAYLAGFDDVLIKTCELNLFIESVHTLLYRQSEGCSQDPGVALC